MTPPFHTINRDLALERQRTIDAVATADMPVLYPESLSAFSEERAGRRGVDDLMFRDFLLELLEELADGRNYLVWAGMQLDHLNDPEDLEAVADARVDLEDALRYVVTAFKYATIARRAVGLLLPDAPAPFVEACQEAREAAAWRKLRSELAAHALGVRTASQVAAAGLDQLHELAHLPEELAA